QFNNSNKTNAASDAQAHSGGLSQVAGRRKQMSSPLAIAAVTAALKDLLNDGLLNHDLSSVGSFSVTSLPPDRVTTGQTEPNQLNLFLYQITPNLGWRNEGLPSRDRTGV